MLACLIAHGLFDIGEAMFVDSSSIHTNVGPLRRLTCICMYMTCKYAGLGVASGTELPSGLVGWSARDRCQPKNVGSVSVCLAALT